MKRELLCPKCAEKTKTILASNQSKEQFLFIEGKIRANHLSCDQCNNDFKINDIAEAHTIWTGKTDYKPWEKTYIIC